MLAGRKHRNWPADSSAASGKAAGESSLEIACVGLQPLGPQIDTFSPNNYKHERRDDDGGRWRRSAGDDGCGAGHNEMTRMHSPAVLSSVSQSLPTDAGFEGDFCEPECSDVPPGEHHPSCAVLLLQLESLRVPSDLLNRTGALEGGGMD